MKINTGGFRPFTITIESEAEAKHLLAALNTNIQTIRGQTETCSLLRRVGFEPTHQLIGDMFNTVNTELMKML